MASKEYKFVSEPTDVLKCAICLDVARDPQQHEECGKLFCKECIEKFGRDKPCPHCRIQGSQYYRDNKSRRDVQDLGVNCDNAEKGCEWEGTVGTLEEHVAMCGFTLVPCPNECEDDGIVNEILRKDLEDHLEQDCPNRDYECEYCGEMGTYENITEIHDSVCMKEAIPCTNAECCEFIPIEEMEEHFNNDCKYTVVSCKYQNVGCDVEMERGVMVAHEQEDEFHLHMALGAVLELRDAVEKLEYKLERTKDVLRKLVDTSHTLKTFAVHEYQGKKEVNRSFWSPSFYTSHGGYSMSIEVYANGCGDGEGTHVSVFAYLLEGNYDHKLTWPFTGKVVITLLNQLEDKNHHSEKRHFTAENNVRVGGSRGYSKFATHAMLGRNLYKRIQYLKDDTVYFRVSVEMSGKPWLECT